MFPKRDQVVNWGIRGALALTSDGRTAGVSYAQGWYHADSDRYERDRYRDNDRDYRRDGQQPSADGLDYARFRAFCKPQ